MWLTVRDESRALPAQRVPQTYDTGGRGLEIVDIVSHEWGIEEDPAGSKAVWASFIIAGTEVLGG
jgi:hypothetical protein